jgi:hypothetical protein
MNPKVNEIRKEKEELVGKALEKDQTPFNLAFDLVLDQLKGKGRPESEKGWFCPEMIEPEGRLIAERVPLTLEVLQEEGYLERKVNMGIPYYRVKK